MQEEDSLALALAYAAAGRKSDANRHLKHFLDTSYGKVPSAETVAAIYAALGDNTNAVAWLDRAARQDPADFALMRCDEPLNSLRADPRVQEMFRRLGLPP